MSYAFRPFCCYSFVSPFPSPWIRPVLSRSASSPSTQLSEVPRDGVSHFDSCLVCVIDTFLLFLTVFTTFPKPITGTLFSSQEFQFCWGWDSWYGNVQYSLSFPHFSNRPTTSGFQGSAANQWKFKHWSTEYPTWVICTVSQKHLTWMHSQWAQASND